MGETVVGLAEQAIAKATGPLQADGEEAGIDRRVEIAGEQPGRDQGPGIEERLGQGSAIGLEQPNQAARLDGLGRRIHDDLVGIDPGVAGKEAAMGLGAKGDAAHGRFPL